MGKDLEQVLPSQFHAIRRHKSGRKKTRATTTEIRQNKVLH